MGIVCLNEQESVMMVTISLQYGSREVLNEDALAVRFISARKDQFYSYLFPRTCARVCLLSFEQGSH